MNDKTDVNVTEDFNNGSSFFIEPIEFDPSENCRKINIIQSYSSFCNELMRMNWFLSKYGRKTIVRGTKNSGKSFFISQLVHHFKDSNANVFAKKPEMTFVKLEAKDTIRIGDPHFYAERFISDAVEKFNVESERNLCFITDDVAFAEYLDSIDSKAVIILEVNEDTYDLMLTRNNGFIWSMVWSKWNVVNVMDFEFEPFALEEFIDSGLEDEFREKLSEDDVRRVISGIHSVYRRFSDSKIPYGVLSLMVRRFALYYEDTFDLDNVDKYLNFKMLINSFVKEITESDLYYKKNSENLKNLNIQELSEKLNKLQSINEDLVNALGYAVVDTESMSDQLTEEEVARIFEAEEIINDEMVAHMESEQIEESAFSVNGFKDLRTLKDRLESKIVGQSNAVEKVVESMTLPAIGLNDPSKPLRTMLFLGPTGVGKTETSIQLANELKEEPMNVIRLDMSEFQTKYDGGKLFGAPPGYTGFEKGGGMLTAKVLENPRSVIILDEVEKAHPIIWDPFLQVLDAGRMTTGSGVTVDFTECIIVMTSNLGMKESKQNSVSISSNSVGGFTGNRSPEEVKSIAMKAMKDYFKPEFINRIDDILVFESLGRDSARKIARLEIEKTSERLKKFGHSVNRPQDAVIDIIVEKADFDNSGARGVQRAVADFIAKPLARQILHSSNENSKKNLYIGYSKDSITVKEKGLTNGE